MSVHLEAILEILRSIKLEDLPALEAAVASHRRKLEAEAAITHHLYLVEVNPSTKLSAIKLVRALTTYADLTTARNIVETVAQGALKPLDSAHDNNAVIAAFAAIGCKVELRPKA